MLIKLINDEEHTNNEVIDDDVNNYTKKIYLSRVMTDDEENIFDEFVNSDIVGNIIDSDIVGNIVDSDIIDDINNSNNSNNNICSYDESQKLIFQYTNIFYKNSLKKYRNINNGNNRINWTNMSTRRHFNSIGKTNMRSKRTIKNSSTKIIIGYTHNKTTHDGKSNIG